VVAYRTTVTRVSCSHPVSGQSDVPTRSTGGPSGTSVAPDELPARQEQSGSADDEITVVLQLEGSLYDDVNTVSESDSEVDDEVDITFRSQHLQRSAADEVQNRMSGSVCERDSRQQCSLSAVAENRVSDSACERDSSHQCSVLAVAENSMSGSVCEFDSRYCERSQQSVAVNEEFNRRCSQKILLPAEQKRKRDDSYHAQHLQRDDRSGIYDGFCSTKSLQPNSKNVKRDVSRHTRSLQTNVACAEPEVVLRYRNSRPDDVIDHSSRRQSRVMNAGHSTQRHMKCSDQWLK